MLKPSGGFLKKLFDPSRMAKKKSEGGSVGSSMGSAMKRPTALKPSIATREKGSKGFFGKTKEA